MAIHYTNISGTQYKVTGGKTNIDGTGYNIKYGMANISGTGKQILFANQGHYAMIYSDGNMIFQPNDQVKAGKTLAYSNNTYLSQSFDNSSPGNAPWINYANNITQVSFEDPIAPTDMDRWFQNTRNMTTFDRTNLNIDSVLTMAGTFDNADNWTGPAFCGNNVWDMYATYYSSGLTGAPACGPNVSNMRSTYGNCRSLSGPPVCGNKVGNMYGVYLNCVAMQGSPVCGPNVYDMRSSYGFCQNITGAPVCGANVVNMSTTYYQCHNLNGAPACGAKVTNMTQAYGYCNHLIGPPACGASVVNFHEAYISCSRLNGSPVCGANVTDMNRAYLECYALTGTPVCGAKVVNFREAYACCNKITGAPACGANVTDMAGAYRNCFNMVGPPACGAKVVNMYNAYYQCWSLSGSPVCGANVTDMRRAYAGCGTLTGSPVCGAKVVNMNHAYYSCYRLTGAPVCGANVTEMQYAYYNCTNITGFPYVGAKVTNISNAFYNCPKLNNTMYIYSNGVTNAFNVISGRNTTTNLYTFYVQNGSTTMSTLKAASWSGSVPSWTDFGTYFYSDTHNAIIIKHGDVSSLSERIDSAVLYINNQLVFQKGSSIINSTRGIYSESVGSSIVNEGYPAWFANRSMVNSIYINGILQPVNMSQWFYQCNNLNAVTGIANFNNSLVENLYGAFYNCRKYAWPASTLVGPNVQDMSYAFYYCNINGSVGYIGPKVQRAYYSYAHSNVSTANTGNCVTNLYGTFYNCQKLTTCATVSSNAKDVRYMFYNCKNLTGSISFWSNSISNAAHCFQAKNNSKRINIYIRNNNAILTLFKNNNVYGASSAILWSTMTSGVYNTTYNVYIYTTLG